MRLVKIIIRTFRQLQNAAKCQTVFNTLKSKIVNFFVFTANHFFALILIGFDINIFATEPFAKPA